MLNDSFALATVKRVGGVLGVALCVAACGAVPDSLGLRTDAQSPDDASPDGSSVIPYVAKFRAPGEVGPDHCFGDRVAIDGDTAVVGATACSDDWPGTDTGAAYVYHRSGGTWEYEATLLADDRQVLDRFGIVAVSGDRVLVGKRTKDAAYVFRREGQTWTQEYMFVAPDDPGSDSHSFGNVVALSGDTAVIGASRADGAAEGSGAVYVWRLYDTGWFFEQKIYPDPAEFDFGRSLGISGNTLVVGGHVFVRSDASWTWQTKLVVDETEEDQRLGVGVAIAGDTIVATTSISAPGAGTYIFERDELSWKVQQHLAGVAAPQHMISLALPRLLLGWSIFERVGTRWEPVGTLDMAGFGPDSSVLGANAAIIGDPSLQGIHGGAAYFYDLSPLGAVEVRPHRLRSRR